MVGIRADLRELGADFCRVEEVEVDGFFDAGEDPVGTGSRRVGAVLRQIKSPAAQHVAEENGETDEQDGQREECAATQGRAFDHVC